MSDTTTKTVDVTPIFNYTRPVEIVKRFTEQLTKLGATIAARPDPESDYEQLAELADYVATNIDHVRAAVGEIMADDVKVQITDKKFPIRQPAIDFHAFVPYEGDHNVCQECDQQPDVIAHTL